jgi:hypothetical protein
MSGITGLGTTYNLPNYTGELMNLTPAETPLLNIAGSIGDGAGQATSTEFEWSTYDLRSNFQSTALEGADAPTSVERVRANVTNVVQIHQSAVSVSYTKQAAVGLKAGSNNDLSGNVGDELSWQLRQELTSMARDVEWSYLHGAYQKPTDNTTVRKTRGLIKAITTNVTNKGTAVSATSATDTITSTAHGFSNADTVVFTDLGTLAANVVEPNRVYYVVSTATNTFKVAATAGGSAITLGTATGITVTKTWSTALTVDHLGAFAQSIWDNGGLRDSNRAFLVNSYQKRALTTAFATAYGQAAGAISGRVGGVTVMVVETDFGPFSVILHDMVPQDTIIAASLDELRTVFLEIPGKGHFFVEPLAKTGASEKVQVYGEVGLKYGAERHHGVLRGLKVA